MKLQDAIKELEKRIVANGGKNFKFRDAKECEITKNSFMVMLFSAKNTPMDTEVTLERGVFTDDFSDKRKGTLVSFEFVPQGKRKARSDSKPLLLA